MKKIVFVYGLIAGLTVSILMVSFIAYHYTTGHFDDSLLIGYGNMLLAFTLIYFGIREYRNKYTNGVLRFGQAFLLGMLIALVASTCYVVVWLVDYYVFIPDFLDRYTAHALDTLKSSGVPATEIASQTAEMDRFRQMYQNPVWVILLTYMEILPVGLLVSLVSAFILQRKPQPDRA